MPEQTPDAAIEFVSFGFDTGQCNLTNLPKLIRSRAYEFFERRGGHPGSELDDWLRAEREVKHHFGL
jgi:hypothetical protein